MSSLCENLEFPRCIWFDDNNRKNAIAALIAGFLFFVGWWIIIDAASVHTGKVLAGYHMCGVVGTLSLIMVNSVSNSQLEGGLFMNEGGFMGPRNSRIWLFLGFVMGFAAVIASCWILFANFVAQEKQSVQWPGIALFLQNALIFIANLIYKFGRSEEMWA